MGRRRKPEPPARPLVEIDDGSPAARALADAVRAARAGDARDLERGIDGLTTAPPAEVDAALAGAGDRVLAALFARGWQPADVVRATDPAHRAHAVELLHRHMRKYPVDRVAERWTEQLRALRPEAPAAADSGRSHANSGQPAAAGSGRSHANSGQPAAADSGRSAANSNPPDNADSGWPAANSNPPDNADSGWPAANSNPPDNADSSRPAANSGPPHAADPRKPAAASARRPSGAAAIIDRHDDLRAAVEILAVLNHLPPLPILMPPPGVARPKPTATPHHADPRMLAKIRALLAKAESTGFPGEAESYSAKAQQLMARHRVDHALVAGEAEDPDRPIGVRITVEHPYPDAKALLLHVVAEANGCRAVWSAELGFSTVFGFAEEIEAVEVLYTSLLVQASAAMVREGSARHDTPARTKTFRQSFMHGYALHVGDRLRAVATGEVDDDRLLPVLARRDREVADQVERVFPRTGTARGRSIRVDSEAGWRSGRDSARRASLDG